MKNSTVIIAISILALLLISAVCIFVPNNKTIVAYPGKVTSLVIGADTVDTTNPPVFNDGQVLLPIEIVKKYFDKTIFWDEKLQKIIITTSDKVIKMDTGDKTVSINNKAVSLKITAQIIAGVVYLPIDFLKDTYNIDIGFNKENNVVIIDYRNTIKKLAEVIIKEAPVRIGMSIKSPIVKKVKMGGKLWAFDEYEKWYRVKSDDGIVGYIEKKHIKIKALTSSVYTEESNTPISDILKGKLNVAWQSIFSKTPDMHGVAKVEGLDVISPTWFELSDKNGTIKSKADNQYIEWGKNNNYRIWAVVTSMDPDITTAVLNNGKLREEVINNLASYAKLYKLDGINVDFENMYLRDKDMFSQFMRELAPTLRQQGQITSVDVGVPGGSANFSRCYDRKALAEAVDYVMVMTYDQHWQSSPESGSVAQLAWVEKKLQETLIDVPSSKLLLGLPFYIREWKEIKQSNGKVIAKQNAVLSMENAQQRIRKNKAKVEWDPESGQFYAEYKKGSDTYKMWLEDENSINLKASLAHKYELAGTAAWRLGFESKDVWKALDTTLKKDLSFIEWSQANKNNAYSFQ
jgi:spore germination protein YaaH